MLNLEELDDLLRHADAKLNAFTHLPTEHAAYLQALALLQLAEVFTQLFSNQQHPKTPIGSIDQGS